MLYGDSTARNAAAERNRLGVGIDEHNRPRPTLFATPMPLVRHRLSAAIKAKPNSGWTTPRTIQQLADTFRLPHLPKLLHKYLGFGRIVTVEHTGLLPVELRGCLDITTELFQSDSLEILKARCSPPQHLLGPGSTPVNEDIFYDDSPNDYNDFLQYAIGRILSLFVVWVPERSQWKILEHLGKKAFTSEHNATPHRLAYLRKFTYHLDGKMRAGPEIGRVAYTAESNDPAAYCLVDIEEVLRPAQLIPDYELGVTYEPAHRWYVNNRIDDATWDMFFGAD